MIANIRNQMTAADNRAQFDALYSPYFTYTCDLTPHGQNGLTEGTMTIKSKPMANDITRINQWMDKEYKLLKSLDNPNIMKVLTTGDPNSFKCKYMNMSSVETWCRITKTNWSDPADAQFVIDVALGIAKGLEHLFNQGLAHGNLRSSKVMMNLNDADGLEVELKDFTPIDFTNWDTSGAYGMKQCWLAPISEHELSQNDYIWPAATQGSNLWAFGVILSVLDTRATPFHYVILPRRFDLDAYHQFFNSDLWIANISYDSMTQVTCPAWYKQLVQKCLHPSASERPDIKEIIELLEKQKSEL